MSDISLKRDNMTNNAITIKKNVDEVSTFEEMLEVVSKDDLVEIFNRFLRMRENQKKFRKASYERMKVLKSWAKENGFVDPTDDEN